jgi:hypothetical protein
VSTGSKGRQPAREPRPALKAVRPTFSKRFCVGFTFLCAVLLYANSIPNGYAFDDALVITSNKWTVRGLEGIPDLVTNDLFAGVYGKAHELEGGRWRPLTMITHALEWELFPNNPHVGHLVNVLLYAVAAMLLFLMLDRMLVGRRLLSLVATLIFVFHPVHTEVVANIKSRDEILAFIFLCTALVYLFKYVKDRKTSRPLILACGFYFLSLLSKENGITFVAVIPVLLLVSSPLNLKRSLMTTIPFAAMALAYMLIRYALFMEQLSGPDAIGESSDVMENPFVGVALPERLATVFVILGKYVSLLVAPFRLSSDYSYNQIPIVSFSDPIALASLVGHVAVGIWALRVVVLHVKRKATTVFGLREVVAAGVLIYLITISIVSNLFFSIGAPMGERFLFLPSLGFSLVASAGFIALFRVKEQVQRKAPVVLYLAVGAVLLLFSARVVSRNPVWSDNLTLFSTDIHNVPNSAKIHFYYGNTLIKKATDSTGVNDPQRIGWLQTAKSHTLRSAAINPKFHHAFYNLGRIYVEEKNADSAIYYLKRVLALQPTHINTQGLMGQAYGQLKNDPVSAIPYLQKAIEYDPNDVASLEHLGICYAMTKDFPRALDIFSRVQKLRPNSARVYYNLSSVYGNMGDAAKAKEYLDKANRLKGGE